MFEIHYRNHRKTFSRVLNNQGGGRAAREWEEEVGKGPLGREYAKCPARVVQKAPGLKPLDTGTD